MYPIEAMVLVILTSWCSSTPAASVAIGSSRCQRFDGPVSRQKTKTNKYNNLQKKKSIYVSHPNQSFSCSRILGKEVESTTLWHVPLHYPSWARSRWAVQCVWSGISRSPGPPKLCLGRSQGWTMNHLKLQTEYKGCSYSISIHFPRFTSHAQSADQYLNYH